MIKLGIDHTGCKTPVDRLCFRETQEADRTLENES